jgi:hypothetical protein
VAGPSADELVANSHLSPLSPARVCGSRRPDKLRSQPSAFDPMADIFVSYAKADRPLALKLAAMLEAKGWKVWWDTSLTIGDDFRNEIMTELGRARAVIVIWTDASIKSDWVLSRAEFVNTRAARWRAERRIICRKREPRPDSQGRGLGNPHAGGLGDCWRAALGKHMGAPEVPHGTSGTNNPYGMRSWAHRHAPCLPGEQIPPAAGSESGSQSAHWPRRPNCAARLNGSRRS